MSLQDWLRNGWLVEHQTSPQEMADLLGVIERDLADCRTPGLSPDWRLNIAYNAALQAATAALAAAGYRAARDSRHYRVIQSLAHTIGISANTITRFERFRKKRNLGGYERAGITSNQEAEEMLDLAQQLHHAVEEWFRTYYPGLLPRRTESGG